MVHPSLHDHLSQLPEYKTPTTLRLSFLYSSLAGRKASNPTGFSSALSWWRLTLQDLVSQGLLGEDKLVLVADDNLRESLRWEGVGRPSSLGTILVSQFLLWSAERHLDDNSLTTGRARKYFTRYTNRCLSSYDWDCWKFMALAPLETPLVVIISSSDRNLRECRPRRDRRGV